MLSFAVVGFASALTAGCTGAPTATNITWSGSASTGIPPYAFLWGNGNTSVSQTVVAAPGTHAMTLQVTDASSTVATTSCSATVATAATSTGSGINAQIQALLNQINVLKAQILALIQQRGGGTDGTATSTPGFPPGCGIFNRDLKHGDRGDDVKELQRTLSDDPSIFSSDSITGFFGPKTQEALMKFQRKFGITTTGFFGPMSRGFLKDNCGKADSDHDGVINSDDNDDDNDGTPDTDDSHPHNPNVATSTNMRADDNGRKGEDDNKGKGNQDNDDD